VNEAAGQCSVEGGITGKKVTGGTGHKRDFFPGLNDRPLHSKGRASEYRFDAFEYASRPAAGAPPPVRDLVPRRAPVLAAVLPGGAASLPPLVFFAILLLHAGLVIVSEPSTSVVPCRRAHHALRQWRMRTWRLLMSAFFFRITILANAPGSSIRHAP